jgi:hypothetical protein
MVESPSVYGAQQPDSQSALLAQPHPQVAVEEPLPL